jgi:hypothetical protein
MQVIHIKEAPPNWRTNPDYVYIGRGSKWGNPFKIGESSTRDDVIYLYKKWILCQESLINELFELDGKILVCYCKPLACHGDVLVDLLHQKKLLIETAVGEVADSMGPCICDSHHDYTCPMCEVLQTLNKLAYKILRYQNEKEC